MTHAVLLAPLAHAGEGATWQALLTLLALGLVAVVVASWWPGSCASRNPAT